MNNRLLKCPYCQKTMRVDYYKDIQIDKCDDCKEIWFDKGELDKYQKYHKRDHDTLKMVIKNISTNDTSICPACHNNSLHLRHVRDMKLGYCKTCKGVLMQQVTINRLSNKSIENNWSTSDEIRENILGELFYSAVEMVLGTIFES